MCECVGVYGRVWACMGAHQRTCGRAWVRISGHLGVHAPAHERHEGAHARSHTHTHAMVNRAHTLTCAPDRLPGGVDGSVCVCVTGRPRGAFFGRARDCLIACAGAFTRCERFTNPKSETANSLSIRHINGEVGVPYGSETVFIVRAKF